MPKIVDHDARRDEIAAAVRRVILRDGIERATVRPVAAEAGWSTGAVRHYFPDHAALVRFAVERVMADVPDRLRRRLQADPDDRSPQALLEELLPLDDDRSVEMQVWLAAMDRARHDPGFDDVRRPMWDGLRFIARVAVAWAREVPAPFALDEPLGPDDEQAAAVLHSLVDGLALQAFLYPDRLPAAEVRAVLAAHLATLEV